MVHSPTGALALLLLQLLVAMCKVNRLWHSPSFPHRAGRRLCGNTLGIASVLPHSSFPHRAGRRLCGNTLGIASVLPHSSFPHRAGRRLCGNTLGIASVLPHSSFPHRAGRRLCGGNSSPLWRRKSMHSALDFSHLAYIIIPKPRPA